MWIKRSLLESRPELILQELKQIKSQQEKLSNKLKSLRLTRGGLLSQENQVKQELGA